MGAGRPALTARKRSSLCDAYGISTPKHALAKTPSEAAQKPQRRRLFPVVLKIVSDDILHKTEAGGVIVGLESAADVRRAFDQLVKNAKGYKKNSSIQGVQVQQMLKGGQEVMVGAVTDPSFGKMIAFGLGGVLVEVMKDITFRMTPVSKKSVVDARLHRRGGSAARRCSGARKAFTRGRWPISSVEFPSW